MGDRLEREIEEILRKLDSSSSRRSPGTSLRSMLQRWHVGFRRRLGWLRITPTSVMVMSLVLFGLSVFLGVALRQLAFYIALLAIVLFFTAVVMSARQGGRTSEERRWRGRLVDLPGDNPWSALQDWWLRQRRKFRRWLDSK